MFIDLLGQNKDEIGFAYLLIQSQWTFVRGALATVDRPLFGWVGRFFLHNVCSSSFGRRMLDLI